MRSVQADLLGAQEKLTAKQQSSSDANEALLRLQERVFELRRELEDAKACRLLEQGKARESLQVLRDRLAERHKEVASLEHNDRERTRKVSRSAILLCSPCVTASTRKPVQVSGEEARAKRQMQEAASRVSSLRAKVERAQAELKGGQMMLESVSGVCLQVRWTQLSARHRQHSGSPLPQAGRRPCPASYFANGGSQRPRRVHPTQAQAADQAGAYPT